MSDGVRLQGDVARLARQMRRLGEFDRKRINRNLASAIRTSTVLRFRTEKGPDGQRWKQSKRVQQIGGKTLSDTATLKNSINEKSDATGFAVGSNLRYAATHQFGDKDREIRARRAKSLRFKIGDRWIMRKKVVVTIPARPYLGIDEEDMQEMSAIMMHDLVED